MIGRIISALVLLCTHIFNLSTFQRKADSDGTYPEGPVLPCPDRCPNNPLIHVKYARKILKSTRRSCKHLAIQKFPERKWSPHSPGMRWDNFSSHTITLFVNAAFIQLSKLCKKWVMTLSSSMVMYSVMRDIPDARKVPIERGWVALHLYATCKFSNHLTLEQWALNMDYLYFDTHCILINLMRWILVSVSLACLKKW